MKKVCHITTVHKIQDVRIFHKECVSLAKNGFDVTLIAFGSDAFNDIMFGVKRISLFVPVKNRLDRFLRRSKAVYEKALEVDACIYHFHDPELLPIGLKLKKAGKKVIFDSHEFYGEQIAGKKYIPKLLRLLLIKAYKKYEKYVCKRLDAVIQVCTLDGKDYFENRAKRTEFIANYPVYQSNVKIKKEEFESRDSVVHVGTLSYNRGIYHLVYAAKAANTKLILAGNFISPKYQSELSATDQFSNVDYKGFINKDEMEDIFNQSFAGISTLLNVNQYHKIDTLPTKVYDYMAAGLPVVISKTKHSVEMVEKYRFGITVNPKEVNEIKDAILFLRENKAVAREMGENGRKAFKRFFNWQIEERKLINLYNSL